MLASTRRVCGCAFNVVQLGVAVSQDKTYLLVEEQGYLWYFLEGRVMRGSKRM